MGITNVFRKTDDTPPAQRALNDAEAELASLRVQSDKLSTQDSIARSELDVAERTVASVKDLQRQIADAKVDIAVTGATTADMDALHSQLQSAQAAVRTTAMTAEIAQGVRKRLQPMQNDLVAKMKVIHDRMPVLKHAVLLERVRALGPKLAAAQKAYLDTIIEVWGIGAAADEIARADRQELGIFGYLADFNWVFPIPGGPAREAFDGCVVSRMAVDDALKAACAKARI